MCQHPLRIAGILFLLKAPEIPVKVAELDTLDQVFHCNLFGAIEVGYGAAYFKNSVVGSCGEIHFVHGIHELLGAFGVKHAECFNQFSVHLGIGINFR